MIDWDNQSFYDAPAALNILPSNYLFDKRFTASDSILTLAQQLNDRQFGTAVNLLRQHPILLEEIEEHFAFMKNTIKFLIYLFRNKHRDLGLKLLTNQLFANSLSGEAIKIMLENKQGCLEGHYWQLSTEEAIIHFKNAAYSSYVEIIDALWNNRILSSYLSGKPTTILVRNEQDNLIKKITQISTIEVISYFNDLLKRNRKNRMIFIGILILNSSFAQRLTSSAIPISFSIALTKDLQVKLT